ncbi:MAG: RuBisCO large subunit C-terminal-like domain-containing protein [Candidatus Dormibacteria bacterium]
MSRWDFPVAVSGVRFAAQYSLAGDPATVPGRVAALAVEQTIEFPADLVRGTEIERQVVGRVEAIEPVGAQLTLATVSYAVETAGGELPQLLNVLFGNCSLLPGVRLVDLDLPGDLLRIFRGPRYGPRGVRQLLGVPERPLLASALKPMGLDVAQLAEMAASLVRAGIDIVKDDHGLANQPFAAYEARVEACARAVAAANESTGTRALYVPSVNAPSDRVVERARLAKQVGAGGLLVLPGLCGLDTMRALADDEALQLPIIAHPSLLGSYVTHPTGGIEHGLLLATLMRLGGADMSIFPSHGGRFTFSRDACRSIAARASAPLGRVAPLLPMPGGGLTVERVPEMVHFYGADVVLLIGGDLYRGDLMRNVGRMRDEALRGVLEVREQPRLGSNADP